MSSTRRRTRIALQDRRAKFACNPAALALIDIMIAKQSNLCVSADLTIAQDVLNLANIVGPYICMLKTHADIIVDFSPKFVTQLTALAEKHGFVIFEDRKFADIGNTVKLQYGSGIHQIASWSHFTNAHPLPGDGIVQGLKEVGQPLGRALLLLAQMSSTGSLCTPDYTAQAVAMAERHDDFVVGFIAQSQLDTCRDFLILTPGVNLNSKGDTMGQQYRTPQSVVNEGCDIIIVGRGIYSPGSDPASEAKRYQEAGWSAYNASISG